MTPAARTAAAIELIGEVEDSLARRGPAADTLAQRYFRQRRYAGSKDRSAVLDTVYGVLRRRGELVWRLQSAGTPVTPRRMVLLSLLLGHGLSEELFGGDYGPEPLDGQERALLERAAALSAPPLWARLNVPEWLADRLVSRFGDRTEEEIAALDGRAPVDLRVNTLKATRDSVAAALADAGLDVRPTPYSPFGLRLTGSANLNELEPVRRGLVEVQDEASQIAALLARPERGSQLAELAAGAGGKTLAFAAQMDNSGQIYAMDTDKKRLEELKRRADAAGVTNVQIHRITSGEEKRQVQLSRFTGRMDLAVVDAPCSGSGTWRRNPELRWRLDPDALAETVALQSQLLLEAMDLAKPSGRLAYMTCSLLREENEDVVDAVLAARPDWHLVDYRRAWAEAGLGDRPAETAAEAPEALQLTPARHGTDGFFIALMRHAEE